VKIYRKKFDYPKKKILITKIQIYHVVVRLGMYSEEIDHIILIIKQKPQLEF
jgi:hypothetical protein